MSKEMQLGIFIFVFFIVFGFIVFKLGNFSIGNNYKFSIYFDDVSGLTVKSQIEMNGINIGFIDDLLLENGKAKVIAKVKKNILIYKNSEISIAATGFIGSKYLNIQKKPGYSPFVKDGDILFGTSAYDMNKMFEKASKLFESLSDKNGLPKILNNLEQITDKINKGLGHDQRDIRAIVLNVRKASENINQISYKINNLIAKNEDNINQDFDKIGDILASINKASDKINVFLDKLNSKDGTIGSLVNDEKMSEDVKSTVENIKTISKDIQNFTTRIKQVNVYWDSELNYNFKDSQARIDAGIIIEPKEDKRYILKGNNFYFDNLSDYDKGDQKYNSITALIEKDFKNKITLHGGLIKWSGGVGVKYHFDDKIGIESEFYRFTRETPWVDLDFYYNFSKWAKLKIGYSDVLSRSGLNAGINISLKDDDISYLVGMVGGLVF